MRVVGRRRVTTAAVALLAGAAGYLVGRANAGGSPLDGRPSSGAVLARFGSEAVTSGEGEGPARRCETVCGIR